LCKSEHDNRGHKQQKASARDDCPKTQTELIDSCPKEGTIVALYGCDRSTSGFGKKKNVTIKIPRKGKNGGDFDLAEKPQKVGK
jgi:hypothetical protein